MVAPVRTHGLASVLATVCAAFCLFLRPALAQTPVWAWGLNEHGQFGDGTTINRFMPVPRAPLWEVRLQ